MEVVGGHQARGAIVEAGGNNVDEAVSTGDAPVARPAGWVLRVVMSSCRHVVMSSPSPKRLSEGGTNHR